MPPLDALAERLAELQAVGSIVRSRLSPGMLARLGTLFHLEVLSDEKHRGGRRVVLNDRVALENWIRIEYPSGLTGSDTGLTHRTRAVADYRDSKRRSRLSARPMYMRGFANATLTRRGKVLLLADLTRTVGLAGLTIDPDDPWEITGSLALVENYEVFMQIERLLPTIDAALWVAGRIDQRVLAWLIERPNVSVTHLGDYDPVGLSEYQRVRTALGARAKLYIPEDLEGLVARYGQIELLEDSSAVYQNLRQSTDATVMRVVAILDRCGRGLEHEALLIEAGAWSGPT